jgi:hypothetical protein
MRIFQLIGFKKVDRNITTAFNYIRDPEVKLNESLAWASHSKVFYQSKSTLQSEQLKN